MDICSILLKDRRGFQVSLQPVERENCERAQSTFCTSACACSNSVSAYYHAIFDHDFFRKGCRPIFIFLYRIAMECHYMSFGRNFEDTKV